MTIGRLYRVLGIPAHVHQWPNITCSVEANSVQLWEPKCKAVNYLMLNICCYHTETNQLLPQLYLQVPVRSVSASRTC